MTISKDLQERIDYYEKQPRLSFLDSHPDAMDKHLYNTYHNYSYYLLFDSYLFHGVRFDDKLKKLESILKSGKILPGNQVSMYYPYRINCNEGKYVSLLELSRESLMAVDVFLEHNITFIIKPTPKAIKTCFITDYEWDEIKENYGDFDKFHQRYSSIDGEYQIKDSISLDEDVLGIYIPANKDFINNEGLNVYDLLKKYNFSYLPIFDQSLVQITSIISKNNPTLDYEDWLKNKDDSKNSNSQVIDTNKSYNDNNTFDILVSEYKHDKKKDNDFHCSGLNIYTSNSGFKVLRKYDYKQKSSYKSYKKAYVRRIIKQ